MVHSINYRPKLNCIVTGAEDRTVRVWEVIPGKEKIRFSGHNEGVSDVKISRDGKMILSAAKDLHVWGMPDELK